MTNETTSAEFSLSLLEITQSYNESGEPTVILLAEFVQSAEDKETSATVLEWDRPSYNCELTIDDAMAAAAVGASPIANMGGSNKRKRGNEDMNRNVKAANDETFSAALLQDLGAVSNDDNTRTAQAALAGTMGNAYPDTGFDGDNGMTTGFGDGTSPNVGDGSGQAGYGTPNQNLGKPAVGTAQWHQQRKDNHKEGKYCDLFNV